jgi:hypothetical protein
MAEKSGWLDRSLERATQNIEERPDYLKPERYRAKKSQHGRRDHQKTPRK